MKEIYLGNLSLAWSKKIFFRVFMSFLLIVSPLAGFAAEDKRPDSIELSEGLIVSPEQLVAATKEYVNQFDDFSGASLEISTAEEYVIFQAHQGGESLPSNVCHFHSGGSFHCNTSNSEMAEATWQPLIEVSSPQLAEWLDNPSLKGSSDPSVWVWAAAGAVTFYLAKKVINRIAQGQYLAPDIHSHSHFFNSRRSLEKQSSQKSLAIASALPGIKTALDQLIENTPSPENSGEFDLAAEGITEDIKSLVRGLVQSASGSGCSHGHDHSHHHSCEEQKEDSKNVIDSGAVVKFAKTMTTDFYREFVRPIRLIAKSTYGVVSDRWHRKQLSSLVWVEINRVRAESNLPFAVAFLTSMVGLKVLGESLESLVVGPYHTFCHLSDAAVLAVGMSVWGSYHCLRQAVQYKQLRNILRPQFWKTMTNSFYQRVRGTTATDESTLFSEGEDMWSAYFLSLRFFSKELKSVIRMKNALGHITNDQAVHLSVSAPQPLFDKGKNIF